MSSGRAEGDEATTQTFRVRYMCVCYIYEWIFARCLMGVLTIVVAAAVSVVDIRIQTMSFKQKAELRAKLVQEMKYLSQN